MRQLIFVAAIVICLSTEARAAKDVLSLDDVKGGGGQIVRVPIRLFDSLGTPIGADRGGGNQIRSFGLQVVYGNASAVQAIAVERSGELAGKSAMFEATRQAGDTASLIVSFQESETMDFSVQGGKEIAAAAVLLKAGIAKGSKIPLSFRAVSTTIANQGGTKSETGGNGALELRGGGITINKSGGRLVSAVSIVASKSIVAENGKPVRIKIERTGSKKAALKVKLRYSGSAKNKSDFRKLPGTITIPAGKKSAYLMLKPVKDSKNEGDEQVAITVQGGKGYTPFAPKSAIIVIQDSTKS